VYFKGGLLVTGWAEVAVDAGAPLVVRVLAPKWFETA